jgi:hypothetical protein
MGSVPWTNHREIGVNPTAVRRGTKILSARQFGWGSLGRARPIQARPDPGYDGPPFPTGDADCLPEVIDWPFSSDDAGLLFDQANLVGIRGRCYNDKANGNLDLDDWWIAVPRTFPAGYDRRGRVLGDPYGFAGLVPSVEGNSYRLRNPAPANTWYPGAGISQGWAPTNVSKQVYRASVDLFSNYWGSDGASTIWTLVEFSPHCGFRDARVTLSALFGPSGPSAGLSTTIQLYWDEPDVVLDNTTVPPQLPAHLLWQQTVSLSSYMAPSGGYPGTGTYVISTTGTLLQPRKYPVRHYLVQRSGFGTSSTGPVASFELGPRTDIPPPFTVTTKNLVAWGGTPT